MNQEKLEQAKKYLFIALCVDILVSSISGIDSYLTIGMIRDIQSGTRQYNQEFQNSLDFWANFSYLGVLTLIGVGITLVRWLNACYQFAEETIGASGFKQKSWAVTGWIVPFINLVKPYQIINEIYKAGSLNYSSGDDWKKENSSALLLSWWIFWVITHIIIWILVKETFKKSFRDDFTVQQVINLYYGQVLVYILSVVIAILWFVVAGWLTQRLISRVTNFNKLSINRGNINTIMATASNNMIGDDFYKIAYDELTIGKPESALWAKAFAIAEGNQNKAKALYVKYRAEQLNDYEKKKPRFTTEDVNVKDQSETKISVYEQNKGLVAVIGVVGLVGIILLASQIQNRSANLSGNSHQSSTSISVEKPGKQILNRVHTKFDFMEVYLPNKDGTTIKLNVQVDNNSEYYVKSIKASCAGFDQNKNRIFYEEKMIFASTESLEIAPNNVGYFNSFPNEKKYPLSTRYIECQVIGIETKR